MMVPELGDAFDEVRKPSSEELCDFTLLRRCAGPVTSACLTADLPGIGGTLKQFPEDFTVEELPAYEPSGDGEHLFLWIEKRGISAEQLSRHLARVLGISTNEIGVAGLKDRQAVTRQYLSVPARVASRVGEIETDAIHVLHDRLHGNKLRTGHLQGNRFSILVRNVSPNAHPQASAIAERVLAFGFPNYYGQQRFGFDGETAQTGFELLLGRKTARDLPGSRRKFLLRLCLSAAQSVMFNHALCKRLTDHLLHRVLPGDVMHVVASGGKFVAEDVETEQRRFEAHETAITGPLFGSKMKQPTGEPAERETQLLREFELNAKAFDRYRRLTSGTRRPYVIWVDDLVIESDSDGLRFRFTLPSGVYATTLLREFRKTEDDREPQA